MRDRPIARPYLYRITNTQKKKTYSYPGNGFEPKVSMYERSKITAGYIVRPLWSTLRSTSIIWTQCCGLWRGRTSLLCPCKCLLLRAMPSFSWLLLCTTFCQDLYLGWHFYYISRLFKDQMFIKIRTKRQDIRCTGVGLKRTGISQAGFVEESELSGMKTRDRKAKGSLYYETKI
jgi:hypothetical protein